MLLNAAYRRGGAPALPMADWVAYLVLTLAGFAAGALNVIAGGGSFLTLPILIFLGLPATVANATNRVGVLTQGLSAVWGFHRYRVIDWPWTLAVSVPAVAGAALGTWAALRIGDETFQHVLATLMVLMTLWTLLGRQAAPLVAARRPDRSLLILAGFFLAGIYGGFVQAGVGFLVLTITTFAGLDLVRGNAVKGLSVLLLTLLSLAIFAANDVVHWPMGAALAAGNFTGGLVGVRLTMLRGHRFVRIVVNVAVILFAIGLWFW